MEISDVPPADSQDAQLARFVEASSIILALSAYTLYGSGMAYTLCRYFRQRLGDASFRRWLDRAQALPPAGPALDEAMEALLSCPEFGPPTRSVMIAWYTGNYQDTTTPGASSQVISAETYQAGLVWPLVGAHPPGAKQQGWDSWSRAPVLPPLK